MDEKVDLTAPRGPADGQVAHSTYIKPQARKLHDPDVTLEEYHYYALRTREEEMTLESPKLQWRGLLSRTPKSHSGDADVNGERDPAKNVVGVNLANRESRLEISDEEWTNASRAFRTASWGAAFYLVRILSVLQCRD